MKLHKRLWDEIVTSTIAKVAAGVVTLIVVALVVLVVKAAGGDLDSVPSEVPIIGNDDPPPTPTAKPTPAISVLSDQDRVDDKGVAVGGTYVFADLFPSQLEPPPSDAGNSCSGRYDWAMSQGGVVSGIQHLRVTIQIGTLESFSVTSVKPVPVTDGTRKPLAGTEVLCSGTGGTGLPTLAIDLSQTRAQSIYTDGEGRPTEFYFDVTAEKSATFDVEATPTDCDCSYELEVTTVEDGVERVRRIRDSSGDPFRVTSSEEAVRVGWEVGSERWLPLGSFPEPQQPSVAPPATSSSICVVAQREIAAALPASAAYDGLPVPFQLTGNDPALDVSAGFSSMCSWTYGETSANGSIPSANVQDWRFPAAEGTDIFWEDVMDRMSAGGWRDLAEQALLSRDGVTAA